MLTFYLWVLFFIEERYVFFPSVTFSKNNSLTGITEQLFTGRQRYDLKDYDEFLINVTKEHDFWAYRDDIWSWRKPTELKVGDHLLDFSGNLVKIDFLNYVDNEVEVINFDVEPLDIYYAGGLLVHNKGAGSDPGS